MIATGVMALSNMWIQSITYRGRLVAGATERGVFLCGQLASRPIRDPERTFVIYMALFAADVLRVIWGRLQGVSDVVLERPRAAAWLVICGRSAVSLMSGGAKRGRVRFS